MAIELTWFDRRTRRTVLSNDEATFLIEKRLQPMSRECIRACMELSEETRAATKELMEDWLGYPPGSGIMATPLDKPPVELNLLTGIAHPYGRSKMVARGYTRRGNTVVFPDVEYSEVPTPPDPPPSELDDSPVISGGRCLGNPGQTTGKAYGRR